MCIKGVEGTISETRLVPYKSLLFGWKSVRIDTIYAAKTLYCNKSRYFKQFYLKTFKQIIRAKLTSSVPLLLGPYWCVLERYVSQEVDKYKL